MIVGIMSLENVKIGQNILVSTLSPSFLFRCKWNLYWSFIPTI